MQCWKYNCMRNSNLKKLKWTARFFAILYTIISTIVGIAQAALATENLIKRNFLRKNDCSLSKLEAACCVYYSYVQTA